MDANKLPSNSGLRLVGGHDQLEGRLEVRNFKKKVLGWALFRQDHTQANGKMLNFPSQRYWHIAPQTSRSLHFCKIKSTTFKLLIFSQEFHRL